MSEKAVTYELTIKWSPAWTDMPPEDPANYDHNFYEGLTLEAAFDTIRAFSGKILEVTIEPADDQ